MRKHFHIGASLHSDQEMKIPCPSVSIGHLILAYSLLIFRKARKADRNICSNVEYMVEYNMILSMESYPNSATDDGQ